MEKQSRKTISEAYQQRVVIGGVFCIRCTDNDQTWVKKTTDMQGSKNRHAFSLATKSCPEPSMLTAWKEYGADAFIFDVLEELNKGENQTTAEFSNDIDVLYDMWKERLAIG